MSIEAAPSKRQTAGPDKVLLMATVLGLTSFTWGSYDTFISAPTEREKIVRDTDVCAEVDLSYEMLRPTAEKLIWDSPHKLEVLVKDSQFRNPIECYRQVRRNLASVGLEPGSLRNSLGPFAFASGALMTAIFGFSAFANRIK